jgi:hypothetical protein
MSTSSSALSSAASSSAAANYFTGMSNFSQDLNNTIQREVQIAGLPIQLLQNNINDLTNQASELQTLSGDVGGGAIRRLGPGYGGRQHAGWKRVGCLDCHGDGGERRHGGQLFAPGHEPGVVQRRHQ